MIQAEDRLGRRARQSVCARYWVTCRTGLNEDRPWTPAEAGSGTGHVGYKATRLMAPKQ